MAEFQWYYDISSTCLGDIGIVWQKDKKNRTYLRRIFLPCKRSHLLKGIANLFPLSIAKEWKHLRRDIISFTEGKGVDFHYVSLADDFLSIFQKRLYSYQRSIPRGKVMSYGALGAAIGVTNAARAIGYAQAMNPFPLIVPCHRVIKSNGQIGGFQSGQNAKKLLLEIEGIRCIKRNNSYYIDEKHIIR